MAEWWPAPEGARVEPDAGFFLRVGPKQLRIRAAA